MSNSDRPAAWGTGGDRPPQGQSAIAPAPCQHKWVWMRQASEYSRSEYSRLGRGGYTYCDEFYCERCLAKQRIKSEAG